MTRGLSTWAINGRAQVGVGVDSEVNFDEVEVVKIGNQMIKFKSYNFDKVLGLRIDLFWTPK